MKTFWVSNSYIAHFMGPESDYALFKPKNDQNQGYYCKVNV